MKSSDSPSQNGQGRDRLSRRTDIELLAHDFEVAFGCRPRDAKKERHFGYGLTRCDPFEALDLPQA